MLEVKSFILGPFGTNTYVVSDDEGKVLLIDPACTTPYEEHMLYTYITHLPCMKDLKIIATHGHLDHLWGAKWATEQWKTPVLMHEADIPLAQAMQQQYDLFGVHRTAESFPMEGIQNSEFSFQIIHTPGHTPGSVCYEIGGELFTGDTLFEYGWGRTDLPGGSEAQMEASLKRLMPMVRTMPFHAGH